MMQPLVAAAAAVAAAVACVCWGVRRRREEAGAEDRCTPLLLDLHPSKYMSLIPPFL